MNDVTGPPAGAARKRAFGRSLSDFRIEGATTANGLLPAEEKLLVAVARGEICSVSSLDWKKPEDLEKLKSDEQWRIRADFLRFLALGGDNAAPVHEKGVQLARAHIVGDLDLESCEVSALYIVDSYFSGVLTLRDARMRGVNLAGSRVGKIKADRAKIDGSVYLREGFLAEGEVCLLGVEVAGELDCGDSSFKNAARTALNCAGAKFKGSVYLCNGFTAEGEVQLLGAEIGADFACVDGNFKNPNGTALSCDGVRVTGSVFLSDGFDATGVVRLLAAEIGGVFTCIKGSFTNTGGIALYFDGAKVKGSVFLCDEFAAEGEVRFLGAEIGGDLACMKGEFINTGGTALNCTATRIKGALFLREGFKAKGKIDLSSVQVQNLIDDSLTNGENNECHLVIDGLTYERIAGGASTNSSTRIAWLGRQVPAHLSATNFKPQPFEQLAKVLAAMGHDDNARKVAMEKQRLMIPVRFQEAPWYAKHTVWALWHLHCFTSGFGYRPSRLIIILLVLWFTGGLFFAKAAEFGVFEPTDRQVRADQTLRVCRINWTQCDAANIVAFRPLAYSADNLLPAIDLGQRKAWVASGWVGTLVAIQSFVGVMGALLFGAIVTGLIKKD